MLAKLLLYHETRMNEFRDIKCTSPASGQHVEINLATVSIDFVLEIEN